MSTERKIVPVIMCGGVGSRLWPLSREREPKQFVPLIGGLSTFQQALARVAEASVFARPIIITNTEFRFVVADQIQQAGLAADIILEPVGRDSGPAIAAATEFALRKDPAAQLLVVAADHVVRDAQGFREACLTALSAVDAGWLVTFGVRPSSPATSYGYIKPGQSIEGSSTLSVELFVEKPDAATAARYVAEGYCWNSGNFLFRADVMARELALFEPAIWEAAKEAVNGIRSDLDFLRLPDEFASSPKKSIDYAVMERTSSAAVLPVDFGWSDIGSWGALWQELDRDDAGNSVQGPTQLLDVTDSLVISDEATLTTVIGLDGVAVITTVDAVLVVPKDRSQQVKDLVASLKAKDRREVVEHRRVHRPWGYYQAVDSGARYQVKRIVVKPGGRLSLQKHFHRAEHWVVVHGVAEIVVNDTTSRVNENESIYVPLGSVHRLTNPGKIPLELIEVQVGSYLGEDDIVRLEDVYDRA